MKGVSVDIQLECDCGKLISAADTPKGMKMLKEMKFKCECGTGYYMHLQEVKKGIAKEWPETV